MRQEHEENVLISHSEMRSKLRSKEDIYCWLSEHMQLLLPPYRECSMSKMSLIQRLHQTNFEWRKEGS